MQNNDSMSEDGGTYDASSDYDPEKTLEIYVKKAIYYGALDQRLSFAAYFDSDYDDRYVCGPPLFYNKEGYTLLCSAIEMNKEDLVKELLNSGADPDCSAETCEMEEYDDFSTYPSSSAYSWVTETITYPVHLAVKSDNPNILKLLLEQYDISSINETDNCKKTPLHYACELGKKETVKLLLTYGAHKSLNLKDNDGRVPSDYDQQGILSEVINTLPEALELFTAIANDVDCLLVEELLRNNGISIVARNEYQNTPLHEAIYKGDLPMVRLLVKYGADDGAKGYKENTPLHTAARAEHVAIMNYLVKERKVNTEARVINSS
jgi:ankyrin repeat protein